MTYTLIGKPIKTSEAEQGKPSPPHPLLICL